MFRFANFEAHQSIFSLNFSVVDGFSRVEVDEEFDPTVGREICGDPNVIGYKEVWIL